MTTSSQTPRETPIHALESAQVSVVAAGVLLAAVSWTWLIWMLFNALPTVPNRWLFYLLVQVGLSGSALPLVRYLHKRFSRPGARPADAETLIRQSIWVGLFGTVCLWLRIPRLLSIPMAAVFLGALIVVEILLTLRERTQWRPE